ncbi:MAG: hypothetical protein FWH36_01385 [Lentimicrobiaceae bacterium]|nr:hypothetical protein [Lentimicrobiaceae bacterium]
MKKVFFVIAASIVLFSCGKEGPAGPRGPQGRDGKDGQGVQVNTYYFEISRNEWKIFESSDQTRYYCYVEKKLNALTSSVINEGAVLVYALLDDCDQQLPYVVSIYDGGFYTRVIRYDLQQGTIGFVVEDNDFNTQLPPFNGNVTFKVVIISKV